MKKKLLILLGIVLIMTSSFSGITLAGNGPNKDGMGAQIYMGSTMLYDGYNDVASFMSGAEYNKDTNTLTLTNFDSADDALYLSEMGEDFKLEVKGTNNIAGIRSNGYGYGGNVNVIGTGKLIINGNKKEGFSAPIAIDADNSATKLTVADTVSLEVYSSGSDNSLMEVTKTNISENAIVLPKTAEIQTEKNDISSTLTVYFTGEEIEYNIVENSAEPNKEYVYEKYSYEYDGEESVSYYIYPVKNDSVLGKCISSSDGVYYSELPEGYSFTENKTSVKLLSQLSMSEYKVDGEDTVYGILQDYFSGTYTAYTISESTEIGKVAIAVNGESDLTEIPAKYQPVVKNSVYTYKVNGESFIYKPSGWKEPETTKETPSVTEPEPTSEDVVTPTTKEEQTQPSEETTNQKETKTIEPWTKIIVEPKPAIATKFTKVKAAKKKVKLSWKKQNVSGYQIQYSLKKSMKNAKIKTIKKASVGKTIVKKLKRKKIYYFQIRTFVTVNDKGGKWYSVWSKVKKAKVK